jgi:hypothetical protein
MDTVAQYVHHIEELITSYAAFKPAYGDVEVQTVFDRTHHHYQLLTVGWDGDERIRGCILHVDIKGNRIWIQHDGTEVGIANELVARGVPKEDIVLAFHAPYKRPYTGFAAG